MLTSIELENNLNLLRSELNGFDPVEIQNIVFFNMESFYNFLKGVSGNALVDIIDKIQPFIPIEASSENMELFLRANATKNDSEMFELVDRFVNKATIDFINTVQNIKNALEWREIVGVCQMIREYKEQCYC